EVAGAATDLQLLRRMMASRRYSEAIMPAHESAQALTTIPPPEVVRERLTNSLRDARLLRALLRLPEPGQRGRRAPARRRGAAPGGPSMPRKPREPDGLPDEIEFVVDDTAEPGDALDALADLLLDLVEQDEAERAGKLRSAG